MKKRFLKVIVGILVVAFMPALVFVHLALWIRNEYNLIEGITYWLTDNE